MSERQERRSPNDDELMGADELRAHLQSKAQESVGVEDLSEANRRWSVIDEWRQEDG